MEKKPHLETLYAQKIDFLSTQKVLLCNHFLEILLSLKIFIQTYEKLFVQINVLSSIHNLLQQIFPSTCLKTESTIQSRILLQVKNISKLLGISVTFDEQAQFQLFDEVSVSLQLQLTLILSCQFILSKFVRRFLINFQRDEGWFTGHKKAKYEKLNILHLQIFHHQSLIKSIIKYSHFLNNLQIIE
ncbi:hypothetical protein TTHERM_000039088 (macronuclear) [Tetrahymena thermophila SB210]|uniref:Uncharacterized protein n=1 Tax=Tetrahymena thermophila (strain SB210) TaxID=312017 RepID=W7XC22_TETTS|nr:hypothetical protein TTHERM_000039088 [Tetrahymena thermophila SB210]EWS74907.1 hypothetical protein TTHERM_000039088 [Tetrahymena thermophila SB210]|eukprot:XP_012652620.1 hypothetical protein TTHERM_000039088 [Tetrahymena thermophila SB210]